MLSQVQICLEKMFGRTSLRDEIRRDEDEARARAAFRDENGEIDTETIAPPSPSPTLQSTTSTTPAVEETVHKEKKRRSWVYQHFTYNAVIKKNVCNYCRADYKVSCQTGTLMYHLNTQHKSQLEKQQVSQSTTVFHNLFRERPSEVPKLSVAQEDNINDKLKQLITGCSLPFSLVDNDLFIAFAKSLNPSYSPPSRNTLKAWLIVDYEKHKIRVRYSITEILSIYLQNEL